MLGTNNTAEISALCEALTWILQSHIENDAPVVINSDSEYATKSALRIYNGEKNKDMIENMRSLLQRARAKLGGDDRVVLAYVKGHSGDAWNDQADRLANMGAAGSSGHVVHPDADAADEPIDLTQSP